MDFDLSGQRAVVTAASKGLGQAIAREFVDQGMTVAINSRSEENLETAKEQIEASTDGDGSIIIVPGDLSNADEVVEVFDTAIDRLDGLDTLVTNHGGTLRRSFEQTSVDLLDETYEAVIRATFLMVKQSLPALKKDGGGSITHIVSTSAREPPQNHIPSNILRIGIYGLSKSVANEYGEDNIRSNCIGPRMVMTDRIASIFEQDAERMGGTIEEAKAEHVESLPLRRVGDPEEFAATVAFLSSDTASYITGASLAVDGGWTRGAIL
jgi:3-oxoacyl-[acyl-carrier protein] reductase